MAYQVFARKYRPQSFEEVIGQEPTVKTLSNALNNQRIHQAYLFCGARGVGKTSIARIFAKSLNCQKGPSSQPCQVCSSCVGITQGNDLDVLEIDGASNTGVDDIRELREQAKYLPTAGKYKIYIIDEVHMLSTNAFNALLKILEEPPPHLIFLFATTEPHKIPVTILSRCQRFDLKRMTRDQLFIHLKKILVEEKISLDDESLSLIIRCSEGSVRDSLSLLDQIISFCGEQVKTQEVREILGLTDRVLLFDLLEAILKMDVNIVLKQAFQLYEKGGDLKIFCEELLELIRHLLVLIEANEEFVDLSPEELQRLKGLKEYASGPQCLVLFQVLARGTEELARSDFPRLIFETTLIKCVKSRDILSLPEILEKLSKNPTDNKPSGFSPGSKDPLIVAPTQALRVPTVTNISKPIDKKIEPSTQAISSTPTPQRMVIPEESSQGMWRQFIKNTLETKPQLGAILEHGRLITFKTEEGLIYLGFEPKSLYADMLKDRVTQVSEMAQAFFGRPIKINLEIIANTDIKPASVLELRQKEEQIANEQMKAKALSDPAVLKAQQILGAKVKEVRALKSN